MTWISAAKPPTPTPSAVPPRKRTPWLLILVLVAVPALAGLVLYVVSRPQPSQPLDTYLVAKELHERGQDVAALSLLTELRSRVTNPRVMRLIDDLARDIEVGREKRMAEQRTPKAQGTRLARASSTTAQVDSTNRAERAEPTAPGPKASSERKAKTFPQRSAQRRSRSPARTSPTKAPKAEEQANGRVRIASDSPAVVIVDGQPTTHRAPTTLTLPAGTHRIEVRSVRDGISTRSRTVTLAAGAERSLSFTFQRKPTRKIDESNPYAD